MNDDERRAAWQKAWTPDPSSINPEGLPPIVVIATTWAPEGPVGDSRLESFRRALLSWGDLHYDGPLYLHVADDGSREALILDGGEVGGLAAPIRLAAREVFAGFEEISSTQQHRKGVGASLNAGLAAAFDRTPLALYLVDDWELTEPLDLTPWAKLLLRDRNVGCVRLGPPHPGISGRVDMFEEGFAIRLDPANGGFVMGHRPALYHQRFHERYGWYAEGESAYEVERLFNEHFCREASALRLEHIAGWNLGKEEVDILYALPVPWQHIGEAEVGDITPS